MGSNVSYRLSSLIGRKILEPNLFTYIYLLNRIKI